MIVGSKDPPVGSAVTVGNADKVGRFEGNIDTEGL